MIAQPQEKPSLQLLGAPITAEKLADMFERLTGRKPTAEGMAEFRALEAELRTESASKLIPIPFVSPVPRRVDDDRGEAG